MDVKSKSFQDLKVWQKSHEIVLSIYKITNGFPKSEIFGLTSQIRRAAISIPANIAEGFKRNGFADKILFYNIAQASLEEVRYYLILIDDLGYAQTGILKKAVDEVGSMLFSYIKTTGENL